MKEAKLLTKCLSYEEYLRLTEERRILILPSSEELIDRAVDEILCHVHRISDCSSTEYANTIDRIWLSMCKTRSIRQRLLMKNGQHKNEPNWYYIANILSDMVNRGIYGNKSLRALVHIMQLKNSVARNAMQGSYQMSDAEYDEYKCVLSQYSQCLK